MNTVSPGPVATALWLGEAGVAEAVGRAAGLKPEEVADRTANVTGADFTIDGGLVTTI